MALLMGLSVNTLLNREIYSRIGTLEKGEMIDCE